jgi:hypothetical protein
LKRFKVHFLLSGLERTQQRLIGATCHLNGSKIVCSLMRAGTDPLVFDPTPGNASSGDEVTIGSINYELVNTSH